jgi:hypothetical protein
MGYTAISYLKKNNPQTLAKPKPTKQTRKKLNLGGPTFANHKCYVFTMIGTQSVLPESLIGFRIFLGSLKVIFQQEI